VFGPVPGTRPRAAPWAGADVILVEIAPASSRSAHSASFKDRFGPVSFEDRFGPVSFEASPRVGPPAVCAGHGLAGLRVAVVTPLACLPRPAEFCIASGSGGRIGR